MEFQILLILSIFGIFETGYLIYKRKRKEKPMCVIGKGCSVVLNSKYDKTMGIHNDLLGLIYYLIVITVLILNLPYLTELSLIIGAVSSLIFMSIQFAILRSFCFWCTTSAVTVFAMNLIYFL
ncbi:MAG: vitamin K epoxide reductase family protein [Patescibacteria group bacterium]|nr:hypothetical protein [Patescibacteria group bacterium]